jgi:hypothetical protein
VVLVRRRFLAYANGTAVNVFAGCVLVTCLVAGGCARHIVSIVDSLKVFQVKTLSDHLRHGCVHCGFRTTHHHDNRARSHVNAFYVEGAIFREQNSAFFQEFVFVGADYVFEVTLKHDGISYWGNRYRHRYL